jgi:hypothetical protein
MTAAFWYALDGKTPAQRRASLAAARAAYQRRLGYAPPATGRIIRAGRNVVLALALTHGELTAGTVTNVTIDAAQLALQLEQL